LDIHIFFKSSVLEHAKAISYSFQKKKFNGVLHTQIEDHLTLVLKGFVVGSQIPNLTLGPSFDYNSCILSLNK
jgi:hypothetical protein